MTPGPRLPMRSVSRAPAARRPRRLAAPRGGALLLVLFAIVAMGAVAAGAVALSQSTSLVSAYQERERDFRYAAEIGLAVGRSRVERDTQFVLPESGYVKVPNLDSATVRDAEGNVIPRTRVTVYAGKTGILSGQFGQFVSLVVRADDGKSTRYVRRLELAAENFARFAMFTNTWPNNGLCYTTGEFIRGLAWSNQNWSSCGTPVYYDTVSAVGTISGGTPNWVKGPLSARPNQARIPMPTVARLSFMPTYAAGASLSFTPTTNASMRLEFAAVDANGDGDSTDVDEGFVRVYESRVTGTVGDSLFRNRVGVPDWSTSVTPPIWSDSLCGDFHGRYFFPVVAHRVVAPATPAVWPNNVTNTAWMNNWLRFKGVAVATDTVSASFRADSLHDRVMRNSTARCFPAGAPQLVFVARGGVSRKVDGTAWAGADSLKGGEDTTFTVGDRWGAWRTFTTTPSATLVTRRNTNEPRVLFPLSKQRNANFRGIVYVNGSAYVSGTLRARLTLYSSNALTFLDDLTYVSPPNAPGTACDADATNMLGIIAVNNVMIDDNALQRPVRIFYTAPPGGSTLKFMSGSGPHFRLHGVVMSLTGTVGVVNPNTGPSLMPESGCNGQPFSGGCIQQVGGVIEQYVSGTTSNNGTGFAENREVDRCMLEVSPPYFPTTGRFLTNRYFESDPARFNPTTLYGILQSN